MSKTDVLVRLKQAEAHELQAASFRAQAECYRLLAQIESAGFYEAQAVQYDGFAETYRQMAASMEGTP